MYTGKSCTEFNILTGIPPAQSMSVSPRGLRALPQLGKCNSDPETWCARCVWPLPTARTKFHVLNRIFPVAAAPAVPTNRFTSNIQY